MGRHALMSATSSLLLRPHMAIFQKGILALQRSSDAKIPVTVRLMLRLDIWFCKRR
ncbi:hypothetical protein PCAR4_830037 [Paraburkholderia caribensis]|nr:hypothetical protein PCAR4_830037 [Paraburkholderia caribensis]